MTWINYTGVGSRKVPGDAAARLDFTAVQLRKIGFWCRTGEADGCDAAFRDGMENCGVVFTKEMATPESIAIAKAHHLRWHKVKGDAVNLLGRNPFQVLGADLNDPSAFLVCWTEDGKDSGGTGTTMRIAKSYYVPIFNFYVPGDEDRLWDFIHNMRTPDDRFSRRRL